MTQKRTQRWSQKRVPRRENETGSVCGSQRSCFVGDVTRRFWIGVKLRLSLKACHDFARGSTAHAAGCMLAASPEGAVAVVPSREGAVAVVPSRSPRLELESLLVIMPPSPPRTQFYCPCTNEKLPPAHVHCSQHRRQRSGRAEEHREWGQQKKTRAH